MNGKSNNSLINNDSNKQIAKPIIPPPSANPTLSSQMETGDGNVALDLVVVIDTSGSMADESSDLSQQIDDAVQKALGRCPSSLRVTFLGIEGTWDNTKFDRSVTDYLMTQGVSAHKLQARAPLKRLMDEIMLEIKKIYAEPSLMCVNISIGEMALVVQFLS